MDRATIDALADALIAAYDQARTLPPISAGRADFDVATAYDVLSAIETRRIAQGWVAVGRKVGFTNRTIWSRYGVFQPMWARVWSRTVHDAPEGRARVDLRGLVQPRIEPEIVFGLGAPVPPDADARAALDCVAWMAPGFELVQSHYPDWKFTAADCTAAFGLHGALVVGPRQSVDGARREALVDVLPRFAVELRCGDRVVDRGVGANVLDSPALVLRHLAQVLASQPQYAQLAAGEIVTTGTLTDAWPVASGQTWHADYGELGVGPLEVTFA